MTIVVQKFGGSSLADLDRLGRVADLVVRTRKAGHDVVVVVSAMGKTTDALLALGRDAARLAGVEPSSEPPRRELDMLVSTGERVSMALLSIAIRARGGDAVSLTGSQSGIITNDRHFDAKIIEVRPFRVEDELARGRIVIVAGYQGMSYRREITTLGRGGSDTTAVALAAALGAERCEIYSDVDGVYTADPRSVPDAVHLPELDCDTMQEMAEAGAKVLNARAVEWAKKSGVVIAARRTADFADGANGLETRVLALAGSGARAVVGDRALALLRAAGDATALLAAVAEASVPLRDVTLDGAGLTASISLSNAPDLARLRELLGPLGTFSLENALGQVSLVGIGVGNETSTLAAARRALPVAPLWFTSSPLRVSAFLPEASVPAAERAWHAAFVRAA
ncbi:MAG TPA: aspartate kinase [Polyangiaceae bacterium]|nr:aspartate kinase [Polyangiaceae bacterium]